MKFDTLVKEIVGRANLIGRPQCCLKIAPGHVEWVNVSTRWYAQQNVQSCRIELPTNLIRISPTDPNITDRSTLVECLQPILQLRRHVQNGHPTVLVLPDLSVRVNLLGLRVVPANSTELHQLVRWKLEKEGLFPMVGSRLKTMIVDGKTVLAVAIRESVVEEYEALCKALGFIAVEIDIASFRLCNLFASLLTAGSPTAWVNLLDGGMSVIIFANDRPVFCRSKVQWSSQPENIISDVRKSLTYYTASKSSERPLQRLVLMTEKGTSDLAARIGEELKIPTIDVRTHCTDLQWTENVAALAGVLG